MTAMDLPRNKFKERLYAGTRQIGFWLTLGSAYAAEVVAGAGFDWALVDMEHSPADLESVLGQLQALAPYETAAVVRVPQNDPVIVKRILDIGALSLLVPYVQSAREAEAAVAAIRYPPRGIRGVAGTTRASRFGRVADYAKRAESELCLIVQVETAAALQDLDAIASTDGVDAVFFGPADLAASMGHAGEPGHPDVKSVILDAVRRMSAADVAAGLLTSDHAFADECLNAGARFAAVGVDANALARAADGLVALYRT
jgi:4-hydroxy-2-oxoheptanedioate aldolase